MKLNRQQLTNIIKESIKSVMNFDMDVGYPLTIAGLEILFKNDSAMKNISDVNPKYLSILKNQLKLFKGNYKTKEEIETELQKDLQRFKKHKEIIDARSLRDQADELVLQTTDDDYTNEFDALYKSTEDYETIDAYFKAVHKEFKQSVNLANQLKEVLSKAKYDKSPTAYQFYSKMKMYTAKAYARQKSLKKVKDQATDNIINDPDGFVKAVYDYISFAHEIFQKQALFILEYVKKYPDRPLPPAMKDFEAHYRSGPLRLLYQQIEHVARLQEREKNL